MIPATAAVVESASPGRRRTVEELVKQVAEMEVVEMQVGADYYLANALEAEFADAVADEFLDIATIVRQWQEAAAAVADDSTSNAPEQGKHSDYVQLTPLKTNEKTTQELEPRAPGSTTVSDTKYCIHCGTKLPLIAKFCSSCGGKQ